MSKKKVAYLWDGPFSGEKIKAKHVRVWKEGHGVKNAEYVIQVWFDRDIESGDPDGDWAMPAILGFQASVEQAILKTRQSQWPKSAS